VAVWETTLACNLKCSHCGSAAGKPRPDELTTAEALKLVEDLAKLKTQDVCLMGGEPLIRKDWYEIGKKVKDLGMRLMIISNGYNIDKDIISKLVDLQPHAVSTSLDGGTAETHDKIRGTKGSFDKVMEYINLSKEAGLPTTAITTVSKLNIHELPMIRDFLLNKFIAWQIQIATPAGRFPRELAVSKEEYYAVALFIASMQKKYTKGELPVIGAHCLGYYSSHFPSLGLYSKWPGCQAGLTVISIKSNGDIIGCLSEPNSRVEGNIRERSVVDIWNDPNAFSHNRRFDIKDLGENCKGCEYRQICRGGCTGLSVGFTGKPHNHPYCFYKIEQELSK
jgi:radical SAM protein with 4Fe4S-binding SPASM domain